MFCIVKVGFKRSYDIFLLALSFLDFGQLQTLSWLYLWHLPYMHFSFTPCMLHASSILSSLIWYPNYILVKCTNYEACRYVIISCFPLAFVTSKYSPRFPFLRHHPSIKRSSLVRKTKFHAIQKLVIYRAIKSRSVKASWACIYIEMWTSIRKKPLIELTVSGCWFHTLFS